MQSCKKEMWIHYDLLNRNGVCNNFQPATHQRGNSRFGHEKRSTWTARAFLLRITMNAIKATTATNPPTTPAMIGIKELPPDSGLGVEGGGVEVRPIRPDVCGESGVVSEGSWPPEVGAGVCATCDVPNGNEITA
jgi:hypothetical protein